MAGFLRGVARTAVIAGTATHVSNNVSRRQVRRWRKKDEAEEAQQPAQPVAASSVDEQIEQLRQLGELRDQGVLTEGEFTAKKQQILGL